MIKECEDRHLDMYLTSLKHGLFATRDSATEAFKYSFSLIETLPEKDRSVAYTALHVVVNTIADDIRRIVS